MAERIPQSTSKVVPIRAYSSTDHVSPATGKTIAVTISQNGGRLQPLSAGATNATEISNGWYYVTLSTTDTGTLGPLVVVGTCTGVDQVDFQFDVVPATNGGLTALPTTAVSTNGSLITAGTGTSQLAVTSGNVTVGTNSDKSGYSLAASQTFSTTGSVGSVAGSVGSVTGSVGSITGVTFPTNFSALAIASTTGQVGVDLTNIKQATTATTLTNITVPTVTTVGAVSGNVAGSVASVTGLTTSTIASAILSTPSQLLQTDSSGHALISLSQAVGMTGNVGNSVGDCLNASRAQGFGKWGLAGTTLTLFGSDGTTVVRTFTLDSATSPTQRS